MVEEAPGFITVCALVSLRAYARAGGAPRLFL